MSPAESYILSEITAAKDVLIMIRIIVTIDETFIPITQTSPRT